MNAQFTRGNWMVVGPSGSGKSTFIHKLIREKNILFKRPPRVVYYIYAQETPDLRRMINEGLIDFAFKSDAVDLAVLRDEIATYSDRDEQGSEGSMVIFDDMMTDLRAGSSIPELFTVYGSKFNCSFVLISQKLYLQSAESRVISANAHYLVLFKSPRNGLSEITTLARQSSLYQPQYLIQAYVDATRRPYSYLLLDFTQAAPDCLRVRTRIFSSEFPMIAFVKN